MHAHPMITKLAFRAGFFGLLCAKAAADSISPASFSTTLDIGASITITKSVTVSAGTPTSSKVDVFFLMDETGSMGGIIGTVQSAAASILSQTAGLGDVAFGVGGYRDVGDAYVYQSLTDITTNASQAQSAISALVANGGGDYPEGQLYALEQLATTTTWRAGSERILVWFGDAPGHDPSEGGITETSATAALVSKGIAVQAVSVGGLDDYGQATRIAAATGGIYLSGINTSTIVDTITSAISTAVATYTNVGLDLSEVPAGVGAVVVPSSTSGSFDRSVDRTFDFAVTFTGVTEGTHTFDIYGTVDGGRVATESDSITVKASGGEPSTVPDGGSTVVLLGGVLAAMGIVKRKSRK